MAECSEPISKTQVLRPLAEKRGLDPWEKIVNFTKDEWFPSRLPFGKFKERLYQEAREDAELRSWLAEEARELAGEMPFYREVSQTSSIFTILNSLTAWSTQNATSWSRA